ncbi:GNAT family N-acetyltransferase [Marinitenerispora sediminis]|uniref:GNAT family N-acetyltransferase n=1 Tax=Marinitenerispora sediminis TaxID=1931232 RepID=A0A368T6R1_9ACTN|nr:GNAT family N-acetyltransferase [Marinitenerispora sediminis]RCV54211.1 GNAT family N-acetyltransferase [Marinitenerispora sediminis]RCV59510.1 GNAT family N-acetyltransferase [Marinitenerispora sediminis]RCV59765.1 GNAT family N-acetyltransferase [Marinitenerispora sediminis]
MDPYHRPADAPAAVAVARAAQPQVVTSAAAFRRRFSAASGHDRPTTSVAEHGGAVAGYAAVEPNGFSSAPRHVYVRLTVHPLHRGRGVGSALADAVERHLHALEPAATRLWGAGDDASRAFARRHGFVERGESRAQRLDLATLPPVPPAPAGVRLLSYADFADGPRPLHEIETSCLADEPSAVSFDGLTYDVWRDRLRGDPDLDRELSVVTLLDGRAAGVATLTTDGGRTCASAFTGTVPAARGRGLAAYTKTMALYRARDRGVRTAYTLNDAANGPMLAVNARLGYRPIATEVLHTRER